MTASPWMKFYPRDWRGDQALRAVSMAARGLWMECLCIMHEAKPYGHLLINGEAVEDDVLARMVGAPVEEVRALMSELRKAGVLSVTRTGVVFSRRMMKDHSRAQKGAKSASKRWSQTSENKEESERPNGSPNRVPITQKPEARNQNNPLTPNSGDERAGSDEALARLRRRIVAAYGDDIPPDTGYCAVWLAQGYDPEICAAEIEATAQRGKKPRTLRYFDKQIAESHERKASLRQTAFAQDIDWPALVARYRSKGSWPASLGPPPDYAGCRAPIEILAKHGYGQSAA